MANTPADKPIRDRFNRLDSMLQEVDRLKDASARTLTRQIVQVLMDVHGAGLERMLEQIASSSESGVPLIDALAKDDLIASLLLLYGLHPLELDERVREALEKVRPYLHSHGGNVELLEIRDGVVRLRLHGSCHGCPSSAQTLKQTIEEAIYEKAPDVTAIEVEGEDAELTPAVEVVASAGRASFALPILAG